MKASDVPPAAQGVSLYLEVTLNSNETHEIVHFTHENGDFYASAESLRKLGFILPNETQGRVNVTQLPGVGLHYDQANQRLAVTVPPKLIHQDTAVLNTTSNVIPHPTVSPGLLLNYDLYGARDNHDATNLSLFSELRAFNAWGTVSNTTVTNHSDLPGFTTQDRTMRLDTSFTHSSVDKAHTLQVGDIISGALGWSRATRLGGVQLRRNFALQPNLITFPVPAFYGQASLPSTVDLYVNSIRQSTSQVPAGPFQLNTIPVVSGNGNASVVVTDALGRQTTLAFPFYTTNQLLKPGLTDYSLDLGFVRENYGLKSFDYGPDLAFSGTWRRGIRNWLTLEGHAEATSGLLLGGAGAVVRLGDLGIVNAALVTSHGSGMSGRQAELGYQWRNDTFNFSVDTLRTFGNYRDIASRFSLPPAERTDRALAGISMGAIGSLGVSYIALKYPGQPRSRYASAYYSKSLSRRVAFNLSANQNLDSPHDRSIFLGISIALGERTSASIYGQHDSGGNVVTTDLSNPVSPDGGFGWRLRAQDGANQHGAQGEVGYNGQNGQILAGVQHLNNNTLGYADLSGSVVFMARQTFFARRIDDSFAVVSTDGVADVPVKLENRPIGSTNSSGDLLVTQLNAYQRNKVSIDPMKLPANVDISRVDAEIVPGDRAGTLVKFGIQPVRAATVVLHDATGMPIKVGSSVTLQGSPAPAAIVGYDGMVYLEHLSQHNMIDVQTGEQRCTAAFDYQPKGNNVPTIGPLVCEGVKP